MAPRSRRPHGDADGGDDDPGRPLRGDRPRSARGDEEDLWARIGGARPKETSGRRQNSAGSPQARGFPAGFRDFHHFRQFAGRLRDRMRELYPDVEVGFQGSSVTGRNSETGAPFDEGRTSDYDIAISGDSVNAAAREGEVPFRSDEVSTGPLSERDLARLRLDDILDDAAVEAGRDMHDSEYRGVTFTARQGGGKLRVQSNDLRDEGGSYHQLPDFPEYRYLLFVDKFPDPDGVRAKLATLPQWRFLTRSVVD